MTKRKEHHHLTDAERQSLNRPRYGVVPAGELERLAREQAKAKQAKQAKQAERANARAWVLGIGLVLGLIALVILAQGGVV